MSDAARPDPDLIRRHILRDGDVSVTVLNLGCITQDWRVPLNGALVPMVLGYRDPVDYLHSPTFMGAIVGRVANRISGAQFDLEGQSYALSVNEPPNHLPGGAGGIYARIWDMDPDGPQKVDLHLRSLDGDQGYPGQVDFSVSITLSGYELCYDIRARADRLTPINLAQHSYYSLGSSGTILDHQLQIDSDQYTPTDTNLIPTGKVLGLGGQAFDFRAMKTVHDGDPSGAGLDMNYVLNTNTDQPAVRMIAPNGVQLDLSCNQPCLQLFTGSTIRAASPPLAGQAHVPFAGVCFEPQGYPNAPNCPDFLSVLIGPDQTYHQRLKVRIAPDRAE